MSSSTLSGYRKKPFAIYLFASIYFLLPLMSLIQFGMDLDGSGSHLQEILFSQAFLWEVFLSFSAAWALVSVTRIGFFYFIGLSLYAVGVKLYHLKTHNLFEYPADLVITLFWLGTSLVLIFSTLRIPYLNPNVKWWTQPPRYAHFRPGILLAQAGTFPVVQ